MQARSALFDVYGDYLRTHGGIAPVAALLRLLGPLGITAPAVRTAISRMVRQGWLAPVHTTSGPGYALTSRATRRLDDASARIYRTGEREWDGHWQLLHLRGPVDRSARSRLAEGLGFLGFGPIDDLWISPRIGESAEEVDQLLDETGTSAFRFRATCDGTDSELVRRAWDLDALGAAYNDFVTTLKPVVESVNLEPLGSVPGNLVEDHPSVDPAGPAIDPSVDLALDERAYAARFRLVHAWRTFLFRDPGLPAALLPPDWPGLGAAEFFDLHANRLRPAASRFVDRCLPAPAHSHR